MLVVVMAVVPVVIVPVVVVLAKDEAGRVAVGGRRRGRGRSLCKREDSGISSLLKIVTFVQTRENP